MKTTSTLSRRTFSAAMMAAPWIVRAQTAPTRARIKIDTERVISDIDPKIYGNFLEHLGRCIDGGCLRGGEEAEHRNPPLARRQLFLELSLEGWNRVTRQPPAASGDGVGHGGKQPLRHT